MKKILIACEESQEVCKAFRGLGFEAYSSDLFESSGGHPEWHIKGDVLEIINGNCSLNLENGSQTIIDNWDLIIAHPPCTFLSNAGARHLYPKGILNQERYKKGLQAKDFFMKLFNANCKSVIVENPIPSKIYELPPYSQTIQPFEFGHPFKKRTCLWLKIMPKLKPTQIVGVAESTKIAGNWFNKGGKDRQKNRSKTFPGIAAAMAKQWGDFLLSKK